jgi:hypothetical protein
MTVQKKLLGKGTTISLGGTVYGRVENLTPTGYSAPLIEGEELRPTDDAGAPVAHEERFLGDEEVSEVTFMHYYEPGHAQATYLETLFADRADPAGKVACVLTYPNAQTKTFQVRVRVLGIEQVTKNGWLKRAVTLLRCSDVS